MPPAAPHAPFPSRFWTLDLVRGGCAAVVFLSHWFLWSDFAPQTAAERLVQHTGNWLHETFTALTWPTGGNHPAVICFFVLSGFCIHYPFALAAHRGAPRPPWSDYFRRRFWRIMPVYWAAAALGLAFTLLERFHPTGDALLTLHARGNAADVLARFAGLTAVYPREILAGNLPLNTVGTELLMYLAYPAVLFATRRFGWLAVGAAFLALHLLALPLLAVITPFWLFNSIIILGAFWYGGAVVAHFAVNHPRPIPRAWPLLAWAVFLLLKIVPYFYGLNLLKQAAVAATCTLGIAWLVARELTHPAPPRHASADFLRYLGRTSYSLYAIHTPLMFIATWALLTFAGSRNYFIQLALVLIPSLAVSLLVYYAVERRFHAARPSAPSGSPLAVAVNAPRR